MKSHDKKYCTFACQSCFLSAHFYTFCLKISHFFWLNSHPDLHHLQGIWSLPHKFHLYFIFADYFPQLSRNARMGLKANDALDRHSVKSVPEMERKLSSSILSGSTSKYGPTEEKSKSCGGRKGSEYFCLIRCYVVVVAVTVVGKVDQWWCCCFECCCYSCTVVYVWGS